MAKAPAKKTAARPRLSARNAVLTTDNDNLAAALEKFVPEWARGTDQYLDIVQWNIEWFGAAKSAPKDKQRFGLVVEILKMLNADLFVFQEVAGPTRAGKPGVMDAVADALTEGGYGDYRVEYAGAGGEQRVAMMWDRDFLRAKGEVVDLFPRGQHKTPDGKDAFAQRTPLYGHYEMRGVGRRFDFQALGVHLKAMEDGVEQRRHSAGVLARWLRDEATAVDGDVIILGDFNAPPSSSESWAPFHELEDEGRVKFREINDETDFSYLWLANQSSQFLSRIDLSVLALSGEFEPKAGEVGKAVQWQPIQETLAKAGRLKGAVARKMLADIKERVSDHLPIVHRFFYRPSE
jgi:endonuclease/exonuclease/phosphatase family metal-dependent hydrolase